MQQLRNTLPPATPSSEYLKLIMKLIGEMLTPEAALRRDANGVVQEMRHIIASSKQQNTVSLSPPRMFDGEQRMGETLLSEQR